MTGNKTPLSNAENSPAVFLIESQHSVREQKHSSHDQGEVHEWSQRQANEGRHGGHVYLLKRKNRPDHPMDSLL